MKATTPRACLALFALLPALASAQQRASEPVSAAPTDASESRLIFSGAVDPKTYIVGPGDKLTVEVWGLQEESKEVEVNAEGRLLVPRIGMFAAAGKTLAALHDEVVQRLKAVYPRLNTNLTLSRLRTFSVYVVGAVGRPGSYPATPLTRISDLLPRTNPLANASTRRVEIRGKSADRRAKADLVRFSLFGETSADPTLLDGDTIYVPLRDYEVEATGAVKRPGRYELVGDRTVKELIELAGGVSTEAAVGIPLRLTTRGPGDRMVVTSLSTLAEAMGAGLRPGDQVHFPSLADLQRTITVEGAIRLGQALPDVEQRESSTGQALEALATPRTVSVRLPYIEGVGVRDLIVKVGGLQAWADASAAYLLRIGSDGTRKRIPVDVAAITGGQKADTPIEPGDTLVIPSRREAVVVGGAVYHPGVYAYSRGLKPLDYVTLAGGATRTGLPQSARVVRRSGQSADIGDVQEIEPGDVISVPEAKLATADWINLALIFANLAVGTTALVYTVTHR